MDRCQGKTEHMKKAFKYIKTTDKCAPLSQYTDTSNLAEKKCRRAVCQCDMEMVRCMKHYKSEINNKHISYQQCSIKGSHFCKTKADVVVLIQNSQGISAATFQGIKTVVRRLVTLLGSETQDYNFAVATYGTTRQMSCCGNAAETNNYINTKLHHEGSGRNQLNLVLSEMVMKQFEKRPDDRKDDNTAKILVIFSDGNTEDDNGNVMDTFQLEKTAKQLRVDNNIKMVGALIPNTQNTQRIQELKGIVSEPDDAINVAFSAPNLDDIADRLVARVKPLVCRVKYKVEVYTPDRHVSEYRLAVKIQGKGGQETAEHVLYKTTQETKGDLQVIKSEFLDSDVGNIKRIKISARRTSAYKSDGWTLQEVKATKGQETVTAVFREAIPTWPDDDDWYSARALTKPYVKYTVKVYTPNTNKDDIVSLAVQLKGEEKTTNEHILKKDKAKIQGGLLVIKDRFTDLNVGKIKEIWIRPIPAVKWTLDQVKVKQGKKTVTGDFKNGEFRAWSSRWAWVVLPAPDSPTEA
ncbi:uncharacterized protein LOC144648728 [Oculina patagonica]